MASFPSPFFPRVGWGSGRGSSPVIDSAGSRRSRTVRFNPEFVNLMSKGGLGWLEGFDELLVRCGLENNGAPYDVKTINSDGSESHTTFGLHGKIANIPASFVAVCYRDRACRTHHDRRDRRRGEVVLRSDPDDHHRSPRPLARTAYRSVTGFLTWATPRSRSRCSTTGTSEHPTWRRERAWSPRSGRSSLAIHVPRRDSIITTSLTHRRRASPSRSTFSNCLARAKTAGLSPCSATGRDKGSRSAIREVAAPGVHFLEEHRRAPVRLRHWARARDQLPESQAVRAGPPAGRDLAPIRQLRGRNDPRSTQHRGGCGGRRGGDPALAGWGKTCDPPRSARAFCARWLHVDHLTPALIEAEANAAKLQPSLALQGIQAELGVLK